MRQVFKVQQAQKDQRAVQAQLELPVLPVQLVRRERQENKVQLVRRVLLEQQALTDQQDLPVLPVLPEQLE